VLFQGRPYCCPGTFLSDFTLNGTSWHPMNTLQVLFMIIYKTYNTLIHHHRQRGGTLMAMKTNFILKVSDAKLADIQKALKDASINVVSILEIHKEEA
jgi:hypothetical protein